MPRLPPKTTLFPYTTLFRSQRIRMRHRQRATGRYVAVGGEILREKSEHMRLGILPVETFGDNAVAVKFLLDRKSTRLNSSHGYISYAVFCLKKKNDAPSILL